MLKSLSAKSVALYFTLLLLSILMVFLVDKTTFVYHGRGISGNGNPGILALMPAWAVSFMLMVATFVMAVKYFDALSDHIVKLAYRLWVPVLSVFALILSFFLQLRKVKNHYVAMREFTDANGSLIFIGNINAYSNSLYYNAYILLFSVSLAILCGWIVVIKRPY